MKIYSTPENYDVPEWDTKKSHKENEKSFEDYCERLKNFLITECGFDHKDTGYILRFNVADGYAFYMFASNKRETFLVHLDYLDGYQSDVGNWTKKAVLDHIKKQKAFAKLFS